MKKYYVIFSVFALLALAGCRSSATVGDLGKSNIHLKLVPHTTHLSGTLSDGAVATGTVYPSIPSYSRSFGPNHLSVTLHSHAAGVKGGTLHMTSKMTDMVMPPNRATARSRSDHFVTKLVVPMFGTYRLRLVLRRNGHVTKGSLLMHINLPDA